MSATGEPDHSLLFSVVVPSIGRKDGLARLFAALARQTLPRERFEVIVAVDRAQSDPEVQAMLDRAGARRVERGSPAGPGGARNAGARLARGAWLAFTEDDCEPADDWLARAAGRIEAEPRLDALEGITLKPGGRLVHRQSMDRPLYLPTNLFVRRPLFDHLGGYSEDYFDSELGLYFREDADFGFTLEAAGAWVERASDVIVTHPDEHLSPEAAIVWAMRHQMDPLLARRHPQAFRRHVEVHRLGPFTVRRPIVRAGTMTVLATLGAAGAAGLGRGMLALAFAALALAGVMVVWAKWRFRLSHLGAALAVPFVLTFALIRGSWRARRIEVANVERLPAR